MRPLWTRLANVVRLADLETEVLHQVRAAVTLTRQLLRESAGTFDVESVETASGNVLQLLLGPRRDLKRLDPVPHLSLGTHDVRGAVRYGDKNYRHAVEDKILHTTDDLPLNVGLDVVEVVNGENRPTCREVTNSPIGGRRRQWAAMCSDMRRFGNFWPGVPEIARRGFSRTYWAQNTPLEVRR